MQNVMEKTESKSYYSNFLVGKKFLLLSMTNVLLTYKCPNSGSQSDYQAWLAWIPSPLSTIFVKVMQGMLKVKIP